MTYSLDSIKKSIIEYCANIGADPLLVQGAGGNVSWKDNNTLWVKASGTWLAEAKEKDIFVPVNLSHLRDAISKNDFAVTPQLHGESSLRPSIETLLHALMPQRVVVHLHAIEILAHLVRDNCQDDFHSMLDNSVTWIIIDYYKPGAPLAEAVHHALKKNPLAKIVFLKNHGVVIGGEDINEIKSTLSNLIKKLSAKSLDDALSYLPIEDSEIHQLARHPELFKRLQSHWVLYPDHVVFLGPKAFTYPTWQALKAAQELPELIFIENDGTYIKPSFNKAKQLQLRCYYDIISRQKSDASLKILTHVEIAELLNWDAEQYRINLAKKH